MDSDLSDTTNIVNYVFTVIFFLITCAMILLYNHRLIAFVLTRLVRYLVLGQKGGYVSVGGVSYSPLRCRLYLKDVEYTTANISLKFIDGYFTFSFWGTLVFSNDWMAPTEALLQWPDELTGVTCQVKVGATWQYGILHAVNVQSKRVGVWLGGEAQYHAAQQHDGRHGDTPALAKGQRRRRPSWSVSSSQDAADDDGFAFASATELAKAAAATPARKRHGTNEDNVMSEPPIPGVVYAALKDVLIPRKAASRVSCHFNGLSCTLLNNTAAYDALAGSTGNGMERPSATDAAAAVAADAQGKSRSTKVHFENGAGATASAYDATGDACNFSPSSPLSDAAAAAGAEEGGGGGDTTSGSRTGTRKPRAKSTFELLMEFVDSIEFTMFASSIDIGGPAMPHPHALHLGFERADGRYSITTEGLVNPSLDLYRHVVDCAMNNVECRWLHTEDDATEAKMGDEDLPAGGSASPAKGSGSAKPAVPASPFIPSDIFANSPISFSRFRERAQLLYSGKTTGMSSRKNPSAADPSSSGGGAAAAGATTDQNAYTCILHRKHKATMQVLYYWDQAGLHPVRNRNTCDALLAAAEDTITSTDQLPKMGVDVIIASPHMTYGPWIDYSRKMLTRFFYPLSYKPLQLVPLKPGELRPIASFETCVTFSEKTVLTMPFKLRAPTPSPPHGVRDSGMFGSMTVELGAGSQMVFKAPYYIFPAAFGGPHERHGGGTPNPSSNTTFMPRRQFSDGSSDFATAGRGLSDDTTSGTFTAAASGPATAPGAAKDSDFLLAESFIHLKDVAITTSYNRSKFLTAASMDVFIDGKYPPHWQQLQQYDYLICFDACEMWYYAEHQTFIFDMIFDFGYVPQMYHGVGLPKSKKERTDVYLNNYVPYIMLYEVFFGNGLAIHMGSNTQNVIYGADATNPDENGFVTLAADRGVGRYCYRNDVYYTAAENESKNPYDFSLVNTKLKLSLPAEHPGRKSGLLSFVADPQPQPFLSLGLLALDGHYTVFSGDLRQEVTPLDPSATNAKSTGRAKLTDLCLLNVTVSQCKGTLTGFHLKALTNAWANMFGASSCCVTPQDLTWETTSSYSAAAAPAANNKAAFLKFVKRNDPRLNDLEMLTVLHIADIELHFTCFAPAAAVTARSAPAASLDATMVRDSNNASTTATHRHICKITMASSGMTMTYMLHPTCGDLAVVVHPILVFLPTLSTDGMMAMMGGGAGGGVSGAATGSSSFSHHDVHNPDARQAFIALGQLVYGAWSHYGPAPHYAAFHSCADVSLDGVSADLGIDHVALLAHLAESIQADMTAEDQGQLHAIRVAARTDEARMSRSMSKLSAQSISARRQRTMRQSRQSDEFGHELVVAFASYMEEQQAVVDQAADYGIATFRCNVARLQACVANPSTDFSVCIDAKDGLHMASSTLNDGNSNKRTSALIPALTLRMLTPKTASMLAADIPGEYLEVGHAASSIAMRKYIAYPVDQGLLAHQNRQREYVQRNDHAGLLNAGLDDTGAGHSTMQPPSAAAAPQGGGMGNSGRGGQGTSPNHVSLHFGSADSDSPNGPNSRRTSAASSNQGRLRPGTSFCWATTRTGGSGEPQGSPFTKKSVLKRSSGASFSSAALPRFSATGPSSFSTMEGSQDVQALSQTAKPGAPMHDRFVAFGGSDSDGEQQPRPPQPPAVDGEPDDLLSKSSKAFFSCRSHPSSDDEDADALSGSTGSPFKFNSWRQMKLREQEQQQQHPVDSDQGHDDDDDDDDDDDSLRSDELLPTEELTRDPFSSRMDDEATGEQGSMGSSTRRRSSSRDLAPNNSGGGSASMSSPHSSALGWRPQVDLIRCLRPFERKVLHSSSLHEYSTTSRIDAVSPGHRARNFTHAFSRIPVVTFNQELLDGNFYVFDDEEDAASKEGLPQQQQQQEEPNMNWSKRAADNSRRSREGSTTTHTHVELVKPTKVFLTVDGLAGVAAMKVAFEGMQTLLAASAASEGAHASPPSSAAAAAAAVPASTTTTTATTALPKVRRSRSRNKTRAKSWYGSDTILSLCLPSFDLILLHAMPVETESLCFGVQVQPGDDGSRFASFRLGGKQPMGLYATHFALRQLHVVNQETMPPTKLMNDRQRQERKQLLGVNLGSVAVVAQIEYEPCLRDHKLSVLSADVVYDPASDTVLFASLQNSLLRVKVDESVGTTAVRLNLGDLQLDLLRDAAPFAINTLSHITVALQQATAAAAARKPTKAARSDGHAGDAMSLQQSQRLSQRPPAADGDDSDEDAPSDDGWPQDEHLPDRVAPGTMRPAATDGGVAHPPPPPLRPLGPAPPGKQPPKVQQPQTPSHDLPSFGHGQQLPTYSSGESAAAAASRAVGEGMQLVGSLDFARVRMVDVTRGARKLLVNTKTPSCLEVHKAAVNISGKVLPHGMPPLAPGSLPHAAMGPPAAAGAPTEKVFQGFAEVEHVQVDLYPEVLHYALVPIPALATAASLSPPAAASTACSATPDPQLQQQASPAPAAAGAPPALIHGAVTGMIRSLDILTLRNATNYAKMSTAELSVFANIPRVPVLSKDATDAKNVEDPGELPAGMKCALIRWAQRAKARAKSSPLASAPAISSHQSMTSSLTVMCGAVGVQYVADMSVLTSLGLELPADTIYLKGDKKCATVGSVSFSEVQLICLSAFLRGDLEHVTQRNIQLQVGRVDVSIPYRPHAMDLLHPQTHDFLTRWKKELAAWQLARIAAAAAAQQSAARQQQQQQQPKPPYAKPNTRKGSAPFSASPPPAAATSTTPVSASAAVASADSLIVACDIHNVSFFIGVMQDIHFRIHGPRIAILLAGFGERSSIKTHIYPFSIAAETPTGSKILALPNVFVMLASDEATTNVSVMVDQIEGELSPDLLKHILMMYEKLAGEAAALLQAYMEQSANDVKCLNATHEAAHDAAASAASAMPLDEQHAAGRAPTVKKFGLTVVVAGLRLSYVCTMSAVRLSLQQITLRGESSVHKGLSWTNDFHNIKLLLCDKGDGVPTAPAAPAAVASPLMMPQDGMGGASAATPSPADREGPPARHKRLSAVTITTPGGTSSGATAASNIGGGGAGSPRYKSNDTHPPSSGASASSSSAQHAASPAANGYTWGLLETNVTATNTREPIAQHPNDGSDLGLGPTVLVSSQQISLKKTLCILRPGLPQHVQYMLEETNEHIQDVRANAAEETRLLNMKLQRSQTFRKMVKEGSTFVQTVGTGVAAGQAANTSKKRKGQRGAHRQRQQQLEEQQLQQQQDAVAGLATQTLYLVNVEATQIVIPFGDAAFRNVLEERRDVFSCGKTERHVHNLSCLNRKKFVPLLALKTVIGRISAGGSVSVAAPPPLAFVAPETMSPGGGGGSNSTSSMYSNRGSLTRTKFANQVASNLAANANSSPSSPTRRRLSQILDELPSPPIITTCRLHISDVGVYFTDGTKLDAKLPPAVLLASTRVLGGIGTLTDWSPTEYSRSTNRLFITSIEIPVQVRTQDDHSAYSIAAVIGAPHMQLTARVLSLINDATSEMTSQVIPKGFRRAASPAAATAGASDGGSAAAAAAAAAGGFLSQTPGGGAKRMSMSGASDSWAGGGAVLPSQDPPRRAPPPSATSSFDVTMKLEAGSVTFFSTDMATASTGGSGAASQLSQVLGDALHVASVFAAPASPLRPRITRRTLRTRRNSIETLADGSSGGTTAVAMVLPLPFATANVHCKFLAHHDDILAVCHIAASPIELSPALALLSREVSDWERLHRNDCNERAAHIYSTLKAIEADELARARSGAASSSAPSSAVASVVAAAAAMAHAGGGTGGASAMGGGGSAATASTHPSSSSLRGAAVPPLRRGGVLDAALPLPKAFATILSETRLHAALAASKEGGGDVTTGSGTGAQGATTPDDAQPTPVAPVPARSSQTTVLVHVTGVKLIVGCGDVSATSIALSLDDTGPATGIHLQFHTGSLAFCQQDLAQRVAEANLPVSAFDMPRLLLTDGPAGTRLFASVHRVRLECQTKLEIKCLELFVPAVQLSAARRQNDEGRLADTIAIAIPASGAPAGGGSGAGGGVDLSSARKDMLGGGSALMPSIPELVVRVAYMQQLYTVLLLWNQHIEESRAATQAMFPGLLEAPPPPPPPTPKPVAAMMFPPSAAAASAAPSSGGGMPSVAACPQAPTHTLVVTAHAARVSVKADLGSGNKHELTLSNCAACLDYSVDASGVERMGLGTGIGAFIMRSEGLISGSMLLEQGATVKASAIRQPPPDAAAAAAAAAAPGGSSGKHQQQLPSSRPPQLAARRVTSADGRTYRITAVVGDCRLQYRERQIREMMVFEVSNLVVTAMNAVPPAQQGTTGPGTPAAAGGMLATDAFGHADDSGSAMASAPGAPHNPLAGAPAATATATASGGPAAAAATPAAPDCALLNVAAGRVAGGLIPESVHIVLGAIGNLSENLAAQRRIAKQKVRAASASAADPSGSSPTVPLARQDRSQLVPHTAVAPAQASPARGPAENSSAATGAAGHHDPSATKTATRGAPPPLDVTAFAPTPTAKDGAEGTIAAATAAAGPLPLLHYLGNQLTAIPTGEVNIHLRDVSVTLGVLPAGASGSGSYLSASAQTAASESAIVLAMPELEITFAECLAPAVSPAAMAMTIKRALTIHLSNTEMYRPASRKQVILALRGRNVFDLYTQQVFGAKEVGFVFALKQTHPWSGSPKIADFEAITTTINAFTNPANADMLAAAVHQSSNTFGNETSTTGPASGGGSGAGHGSPLKPHQQQQQQRSQGQQQQQAATPDAAAPDATAAAAATATTDERIFIPLKPSKFNPELRFGGDVSVNVETVLGWLGIKQTMVPQLLICSVADPLEGLLSACELKL